MTDRELLEMILNNQQETNKRLDGLEQGQQDMGKRLDKLENKVDMLSLKHELTHNKLKDLSLDVQNAERDITRNIKHLKDDTETLVVVLQGKGILPKAQ